MDDTAVRSCARLQTSREINPAESPTPPWASDACSGSLPIIAMSVIPITGSTTLNNIAGIANLDISRKATRSILREVRKGKRSEIMKR